MEIERKYKIEHLPEHYTSYPFHQIEQGYLCSDPVVRVRREDEKFYITYKSKGLLSREEYNLPLTKDAYHHLIQKADGHILTKKRYFIPIEHTDLVIELDVFEGTFKGLVLAEVEFPSLEAAESFVAPSWFSKDVTFSGTYQNSTLSMKP